LDGLGTLGIKDSCSIYLLEKPAWSEERSNNINCVWANNTPSFLKETYT
jgi:hypothetical protein